MKEHRLDVDIDALILFLYKKTTIAKNILVSRDCSNFIFNPIFFGPYLLPKKIYDTFAVINFKLSDYVYTFEIFAIETVLFWVQLIIENEFHL
jgi:hypothetical protein